MDRIFMYILLAQTIIFIQIPTIKATFTKKPSHCRYIQDNVFEYCSSAYMKKKNFTNRIKDLASFQQREINQTQCSNKEVCGTIFKISRLHGTFREEMHIMISDMLSKCCPQCGRYHLTEIDTDMPHVNQEDLESADIIFPSLGRASVKEMYGYHFIPVFEIPDAYYFTLEMSEEELAYKIIMSCLNMWPLLVICVLWAIIAGFFIWLFETWHNWEEFPRPFLAGVSEGFWWAFVSMTTVGYGDKVPKRWVGRIFAVIWILVGITITSMYVGGLAGTIYSLQSGPGKPNLEGRVVGGCTHQLQDATLVAQHGGILHDVEEEDLVVGATELIKQLNKGGIDGFVLNKLTYEIYRHKIREEEKYKRLAEEVKGIHLAREDLLFRGEKLVTGMLVKSDEAYRYLRTYVEHNWLQIQACNSFDINSRKEPLEIKEQSHFQGLFYPFFYGTMITMFVLGGVGFLFECYRRKRALKNLYNKSEEQLVKAYRKVSVMKS